jgi:D-alanine-D-alanine ligase
VESAKSAIDSLLQDNRRVMIERLVKGRELTVGLLHGKSLPVVEITPAGSTFDFAAKYDRHDTQYTVHPALEGAIETQLTQTACKLGELCEVRDLARVDFLVDAQGTPWLLEVNTMPGFTGHSLLPMAAAAQGLSMEQLCDGLIQAAHHRGRESA